MSDEQPLNTPNLIAALWGEQILEQINGTSFLERLYPPRELTKRERRRARRRSWRHKRRIQLASWIAGYDVDCLY